MSWVDQMLQPCNIGGAGLPLSVSDQSRHVR